MSNYRYNHRAGFTLVEMLIYLSMVLLFSFGSITALFSLQDILASQKTDRLITATLNTALERMLFEIRQSDGVDTGASTLEATPGVLVLDNDGNTFEFSLVGDELHLLENGVDQGSLSPSGVTVDKLRFYHYDNGRTEAVRVYLEVTATVGDFTQTEKLYGAAVPHGSYEE